MPPPPFSRTAYLGDSVYAGYDGFQVWVWTDNGSGPNQEPIAIEPYVMEQLESFYQRCARQEA